MMRVPLQTQYRNIRTDLNQLNSDLFKINNRISSGKEMSRLSDDPVSLAVALGYRTTLVEIRQFQENLLFGDDVIAASEEALTQTKDLAIRAKVLALQAVNASQTAETRLSTASEAHNLFEQSLLLANSQVNGKYIFGGFRTVGYTAAEPAPFVKDQRDGYLLSGRNLLPLDRGLTGTVGNAAIAAGDLAVNGNVTGAIGTAPAVFGLNMTKAESARNAVNAADPAVTASLTTLTAGAAAVDDPLNGQNTEVFFYLNDRPLSVIVPDGTSSAGAAVTAINSISDLTGVRAEVGNGSNGGVNNSVVFRNLLAGDESAIEVSGFQVINAGGGSLGFGNFSQAADNTHNTGEITISASSALTLSSPNNPADDSILSSLGLGGGGVGFNDDAGDGTLIYGYQAGAGDLMVNGRATIAAVDDGISDVYGDISAAAKAAVINADSANTGVTARATPAYHQGGGAVQGGVESQPLTGTVNGVGIAAGDLELNGYPLGAIAPSAAQNGLFMAKAFDLMTAVNQQAGFSGVSASLTTLSAGAAATAGTITTVSFDLNGVAITYDTGAAPALDTISAINSVREQTGVSARLGDGSNGGAAGAVVLSNSLTGDDSDIVISGYSGGLGSASTGLGNVSQGADAAHNTGQVSLASEDSFTIASPSNPADDLVLNTIGLGGGEGVTGVANDQMNDGRLSYGSTPAVLKRGDLKINGIDIFDSATHVLGSDADNSLVDAINAKTALTGVGAARTGTGSLLLTAVDGRNLHVETSALGEKVSRINGGSGAPQDRVYFGFVQLLSDRSFRLEGTVSPDGYEGGLAAFGLAGGSTTTGEPGDLAGDGVIDVAAIASQVDNVRYNGDRLGDLEIKVGSNSNLTVGRNGQDAVMDTGVFTVFKGFEDALEGRNFRQVTSAERALFPSQTLAGASSGLERAGELRAGTFNLTVFDHSFEPPGQFIISIPVDPAKDSLQDIATRINGVPGASSHVDSGGHLHIEGSSPDRYTIYLEDDTGNFLNVMGMDFDQMQIQALGQSVADLETLQDTLTRQISDFGARANRISVQTQIFDTIEISHVESLSEVEDTDMVKAVMELKAKQVAYEAALNSAAKVMQLSLVDFL